MGRRQRLISTSILSAIFQTSKTGDRDKRISFLGRLFAFFSVFSLALSRYRAELFKYLRNTIWEIEEEEYTESFRSPSKGKRTDLISVGDLGYSGSVRPSPVSSSLRPNIHLFRPFSLRPTRNFSSNRSLALSNSLSFARSSSTPTRSI